MKETSSSIARQSIGRLMHFALGISLAVMPAEIHGQMAVKGKLLLAEDFQEHAEYSPERQPVRDGWQVYVAHGNWKRSSDGVQSSWQSGHMPVLVFEGSFRDVVIELDFRFHGEPGKWGGARISAANSELDPEAYAASVWANPDGGGHDGGRPQGMILEYDSWKLGPTTVANKPAPFESDTWYTMRVELIGNKVLATSNGVTVFGTHQKFGLPKTAIYLGAGLCPHDLRKFRVYEAQPNPAWSDPAPENKSNEKSVKSGVKK